MDKSINIRLGDEVYASGPRGDVLRGMVTHISVERSGPETGGLIALSTKRGTMILSSLEKRKSKGSDKRGL